MPVAADRDPALESLLQHLKRSRGFDFTGYKRPSLTRRIQKRMHEVQAEDFGGYLDYLEANPGEFEKLFDALLINVTSFFRDRETWDYLRAEVVPRILDQKGPAEPIRIWSAGCATGEEAYTLAILFAEALGPDAFRQRVKVYATDLDESALTAARHAVYRPKDVEHLPAEIVERFFERSDSRVAFRGDLRRSLVFGRNDLIRDAPISRLDLLVCRNALMYFDAPTQGRILGRFYFALNEGGYLLLGRAETLLGQATMFAPVDLKRRVFQKSSRTRSGIPMWTGTTERATGEGPADVDLASGLRDAALYAGSLAQLVIDQSGTLVFSSERANAMLHVGANQLGRPLAELELSYQPIELRSLIDQAHADRRTSVRPGVQWRTPGSSETRWLDVQAVPLYGQDGIVLGTSLTFADVTAQHELRTQLEQSEHELEAAYGEVQSTNEELETTNEELQSTVEELETTNEELQSTNEELETMNEELQSANEELQTMNQELRTRGDELNDVNRFLEQIFTSLRQGVAVLNPELRVLVWNRKADDLWGVRAEEAEGSHFLSLEIGLPVDRLQQPIRNALRRHATVQEVILPATNRRGKAIQCRVVCAPLVSREADDPTGVILVMEETPAEVAAD